MHDNFVISCPLYELSETNQPKSKAQQSSSCPLDCSIYIKIDSCKVTGFLASIHCFLVTQPPMSPIGPETS